MDSTQRVVRRSGLFSRLLTALVYMSAALLFYSVWRENAPDHLTDSWPWKLKLLDLQSATTAVVGSLGASLARSQYARTVRPALGYFGRVMTDMAPAGRLAWGCHVLNGAQDVAIVEHMAYRVELTVPSGDGPPVAASSRWTDREEAVQLIASRGPEPGTDFDLHFVGAGRPIPAQGLMLVGWFTETAMREVRSVLVQVRVTDRVGDTHERVIDVLKAADRTPLRPGPLPF